MEHHHNHHHHQGESEITPVVSYDQGKLTIEIKDNNGYIPELQTSHEKHMHLIIMSSDLQDYYHLHPEKHTEGVYVQKVDLPEGNYNAFVDINPKNHNYAVTPIHLKVGSVADEQINKLKVDTKLTKTVKGKTVELITDSIKVNKEVTFTFDVKGNTPEPYLGALGHVVITDEKGHQFIHVHPLSVNETTFVTQFDERGIYKMWVEFKFDGTVHAYPFVIEVL